MEPQIPYIPKNKVRIVTAASLFDGHDAAINIMRRIIQATGVEVIHLGHDRSVSKYFTIFEATTSLPHSFPSLLLSLPASFPPCFFPSLLLSLHPPFPSSFFFSLLRFLTSRACHFLPITPIICLDVSECL